MRNWQRRATALSSAASPASMALVTVGGLIGLRGIYMVPSVNYFSGQVIKFLFMISLGWLLYNLVAW